jgi:hypothetical protein
MFSGLNESITKVYSYICVWLLGLSHIKAKVYWCRHTISDNKHLYRLCASIIFFSYFEKWTFFEKYRIVHMFRVVTI